MDRTTVAEAITDACVDLLQADRATLDEATRFAEDLDADSLDLSEIVMSLEDRFGLSISDDELEGVTTIGQAIDMVLRVTGDA